MIVPVLSKRRFDFGYLAGATTQSVVLQPALDVGAYYYVQLWVRVHERSMTSGQSLDLSLYNTLPDDLDPREFTGDEAREVRGPGLPRTAWHMFRGGIDGVVAVPVRDERDPVTVWVFSTRTPDRVSAAIRRAQAS